MRNLSLLFLALLALTSAVWANDGSVVGEGGRVRFMSGEDANIRMDQEWVIIDVYKENYTVNATFKFVNDADSEQTVEMGFPEGGGGDGAGGETPGFISFTSKVDNAPVMVERKLARSKNLGDGDYQAFWVKKVTFQPRQTRWVQVTYTSPHGSMSDYPRDNFAYMFTGGNWKGVVTSTELLITFHNPGIWLVKSLNVELQQKDNRLYRKWENWQAEQGFFATFAPAMPGTLVKLEGESSEERQQTVFLVTNKGNSGDLEAAPDGLVRKGVVYVKLDDVVAGLEHVNEKNPNWTIEQNWDGETDTATIIETNKHESAARSDHCYCIRISIVSEYTVYIVPSGSDYFSIENEYGEIDDVSMKGKTFLIDDPEHKGEKLMYVPLVDVVKALKGKYEEHLENNTFDYSFNAVEK